eukprot:CFRG4831T1
MGPKAIKFDKFAEKKTKQTSLASFFSSKSLSDEAVVPVAAESDPYTRMTKRPRVATNKENMEITTAELNDIKKPCSHQSSTTQLQPSKSIHGSDLSTVSDDDVVETEEVTINSDDVDIVVKRCKGEKHSKSTSRQKLVCGIKLAAKTREIGDEYVPESEVEFVSKGTHRKISKKNSDKVLSIQKFRAKSTTTHSHMKDDCSMQAAGETVAATGHDGEVMECDPEDVPKQDRSGNMLGMPDMQQFMSKGKNKRLHEESASSAVLYAKNGKSPSTPSTTQRNSSTSTKRSPASAFKRSTGSTVAVRYTMGANTGATPSSEMSAAKPYKRIESKDYTPLENQYIHIKRKYSDAVLFVECGYKYKFFDEDAKIAAKALNIMCIQGGHLPTASIPVQRLPIHVRRLVELNYKVGVVRQIETAAIKAASSSKSGVFIRELTAMYTKGTLVGEDVTETNIDETGGNGFEQLSFLLCVHEFVDKQKTSTPADDSVTIGLVAVHIGTGEIVYDSFVDSCTRNQLHTRIAHLNPSEILLWTSLSTRTQTAIRSYASTSGVRIEHVDQDFSVETASRFITEFYDDSKSRQTEDGFLTAIQALPQSVLICFAYLIQYLKDFALDRVFRFSASKIVSFEHQGCMQLTSKTIANLELLVNSSDNKENGSLLQVVNKTKTQFGKRRMGKWITRPLTSANAINARLDAVTELRNSHLSWLPQLRSLLQDMPDLERGLTRVLYKKIGLPEFWSILQALQHICNTFEAVDKERSTMYKNSKPALEKERSVEKEDPSDTETDKEDVHSRYRPARLLDDLIGVGMTEIKDHVLRFVQAIDGQGAMENDKTSFLKTPEDYEDVQCAREKIKSILGEIKDHRKDIRKVVGNPSLEYVTVSGAEYLIEVTLAAAKRLPKEWINISGTKKVSRFRTPKLEKLIQRLQEQRERLNIACEAAWIEMLEHFGEVYDSLSSLTDRVATVDCLLSLADVSLQQSYCRPVLLSSPPKGTSDEDDKRSCIYMNVEAGRHPMISALIDEKYVPNNVQMSDCSRFLVITGPNMGGKSCYMKQVALLSIMAQIGSYVPADSCEMCPFDAVHTRMGACDYIDKGVSTFMVELQDAAEILNKATTRSLVLVDELGRGTSTHDGVAIAYATSQSLITDVGCAVLFATHYPLLAQLEIKYPTAVSNHYMDFFEEETKDEDGVAEHAITFLYTLARGVAKRSYGLNVARLADLPSEIIQMASTKSLELEKQISERGGMARDEAVMFSRIQNVLQKAEQFSDDKTLLDDTLKQIFRTVTQYTGA